MAPTTREHSHGSPVAIDAESVVVAGADGFGAVNYAVTGAMAQFLDPLDPSEPARPIPATGTLYVEIGDEPERVRIVAIAPHGRSLARTITVQSKSFFPPIPAVPAV